MAPSRGRLPRRALALASLAAVVVAVAGCAGDFSIREAVPPDAATVQGQDIRNIYDIVFLIGAAIFVFVEGLILWAVLRYRRRKGDDELPPQVHGNMLLEIVWTAIPIAIVMFLFVLSWQTLNRVDARKESPDITIGVSAFQWQWLFVYAPPGIRWEDCAAAANKGKCVTIIGTAPPATGRATWKPPELHVPLGLTVELQLHSSDVIHSFYVPAFLFQRDITPRADQIVQFTADKIGTYRGQCTQFCGRLHADMEFAVVVETPEQYQAWLKQGLTPAPSASPAATPAPGASASPGPGGGPAPSDVPGGSGATLALAAANLAFDKASLEVPADTPFKITFINNDAGIPHNVAIHKGSPTGEEVFRGDIFNGTETRTYDVPALPAGTYGFVCSVHPTMTGTLTVK